MTTSISYSLIIGLISALTQAARGQQSGPRAASGSDDRRGTSKKPGAPPESEVATANNPIAPMNTIYFQKYYPPTVYGVPASHSCSKRETDNSAPRSLFQVARTAMAINSQDWETLTFSTRSEYRLKDRRMFSLSGRCSSLPPRRIVLSRSR
jgi:hypothetical protein